jgi:AraC-like DNA-binding protein
MMTEEKSTFNFHYLWHFLPFLIFFSLSMIFLNKPVMEGTKGFLLIDKFISLRIIYGVSFFISISYYSVATFLVINKHQRNLKTLISYSSSKYTLQWLIGLSVTFYLSYILVFVLGLMDILLNFMPFDPYELSFLGLTIFAFLYGFYGFKQPSVFEEIGGKYPILDNKNNRREKKYSRSGLKSADIKRYEKMILEYMEKEKPYLDRELSVNMMANEINIPRHFISEIINTHMGKNFYYLVNEYRVKEVKERLLDPKYDKLTILSIAYDSGFNSKSAFNTIFKDLTGITPSQYMKEVKKQH